MSELLFKQESYEIIGACFEVSKEMGCGFTESLYQECLGIEFGLRGIPFDVQVDLPLTYKNRPLATRFRPDFICYGKIVVEIKAVSELVDEHRAQVLNYLNATHHALSLLVNFGHHPKIEHERFALSQKKSFRDDSRLSRANHSSHSPGEEITL
jgi:GxxExxY protein